MGCFEMCMWCVGAAVAGGGRWKHDMFEELIRREETGTDPEVG
jgi:hypothetical protein